VIITSSDDSRGAAAQQQNGAEIQVKAGAIVFFSTSCVNCQPSADFPPWKIGPDLTHLMSRDTLASGAAPNTPEKIAGLGARPANN